MSNHFLPYANSLPSGSAQRELRLIAACLSELSPGGAEFLFTQLLGRRTERVTAAQAAGTLLPGGMRAVSADLQRRFAQQLQAEQGSASYVLPVDLQAAAPIGPVEITVPVLGDTRIALPAPLPAPRPAEAASFAAIPTLVQLASAPPPCPYLVAAAAAPAALARLSEEESVGMGFDPALTAMLRDQESPAPEAEQESPAPVLPHVLVKYLGHGHPSERCQASIRALPDDVPALGRRPPSRLSMTFASRWEKLYAKCDKAARSAARAERRTAKAAANAERALRVAEANGKRNSDYQEFVRLLRAAGLTKESSQDFLGRWLATCTADEYAAVTNTLSPRELDQLHEQQLHASKGFGCVWRVAGLLPDALSYANVGAEAFVGWMSDYSADA